jgi:hypothetical protein
VSQEGESSNCNRFAGVSPEKAKAHGKTIDTWLADSQLLHVIVLHKRIKRFLTLQFSNLLSLSIGCVVRNSKTLGQDRITDCKYCYYVCNVH